MNQNVIQDPKMFDRNYFQVVNSNPDSLRFHNPIDRLFETSQIYQNFKNEPYQQPTPQTLQTQHTQFQQTRVSKSNIVRGDDASNRMFIEIAHRNYNDEVSQRINGFGIVPKDTRYENNTKSKSNNDSIEMRTNRYLGMPSNNL
jgi:hypothetical protein